MPESGWALLRIGRRSPVVVLLVTLFQFACADSQADLQRDALSERTVEDQELLVLGSAFDNPDQEFSRVVGGEMVGDSAVLVVSAGTHDMRLFSLTGSLLRAYGREGEGPGENRGIGEVFAHGDTVWTFDVLLKRVDLWSLKEGYSRSTTMPLVDGVPVWTVFGVFSDGSLLGSSRPRPQSVAGGTTDTHVELVRWAPGSNEPTPLHSAFWNRRFTIVQPNSSTSFPNPLSDVASVVVSGTSYWYTDSRSATLLNYSMSGELLRTVELPFELDPVGRHDRDVFEASWMEGSEGQSRQRLQAVVDGAVYPETFPAVTDLVVAKDGSVWAGRYVRQEETHRTWYVVSADGAIVERVIIPAGIALVDIGEERVLGVRRDENGTEYVIVYRLAPQRPTD